MKKHTDTEKTRKHILWKMAEKIRLSALWMLFFLLPLPVLAAEQGKDVTAAPAV